LAVAAASLQSDAASFDCSKARSRAEKLICASPELSRRDDELFSLYSKAKAASKDQAEFKREAEAAWRARENSCRDATCLFTWYSERIAHYEAALPQGSPAISTPSGEPAQVSFTWMNKSQIKAECLAREAMTATALRYRLSQGNLVTADDVAGEVVRQFAGRKEMNPAGVRFWAPMISGVGGGMSGEVLIAILQMGQARVVACFDSMTAQSLEEGRGIDGSPMFNEGQYPPIVKLY
jgi:uncharacterized protein